METLNHVSLRVPLRNQSRGILKAQSCKIFHKFAKKKDFSDLPLLSKDCLSLPHSPNIWGVTCDQGFIETEEDIKNGNNVPLILLEHVIIFNRKGTQSLTREAFGERNNFKYMTFRNIRKEKNRTEHDFTREKKHSKQ